VPVWRIKSESFPQIAQLEAFGGWFSTKIGAAANFLFCNSPFLFLCAKSRREAADAASRRRIFPYPWRVQTP
jgi:hypothetical protein